MRACSRSGPRREVGLGLEGTVVQVAKRRELRASYPFARSIPALQQQQQGETNGSDTSRRNDSNMVVHAHRCMLMEDLRPRFFRLPLRLKRAEEDPVLRCIGLTHCDACVGIAIDVSRAKNCTEEDAGKLGPSNAKSRATHCCGSASRPGRYRAG